MTITGSCEPRGRATTDGFGVGAKVAGRDWRDWVGEGTARSVEESAIAGSETETAAESSSSCSCCSNTAGSDIDRPSRPMDGVLFSRCGEAMAMTSCSASLSGVKLKDNDDEEDEDEDEEEEDEDEDEDAEDKDEGDEESL